ncbi:hypothetical protein BASA62_009140 [Batrachochytrium salamandrivorans]|nr:hypothetical protein BASA62_009140 [Batrachochytrium salamandrivorans]
MPDLRFDGRVVLITGAGGGLGKAYSLFFASRGASVVVNDLGSTRTGGDASGSHRAADVVVDEICKAGGKAVANYDSVEFGENIVDTAIKAFGRIDIVINNAGILRDKSFSRMTDADWDLIQTVHVKGAYKVTKAAWEHMLKQGYGRIINTASAAGIYGNFGQSNYSADMLAALKPEFVVPLVAYLTHESCAENGSLFEVGAGFVSKLRWERSKGAVFKADATFTPASVGAKWKQITDFTKPDYPSSIMDTNWIGLLEQAKSLSDNPNPSPLRFEGRVAIVTGAGNGIGRAYAHLFSKLGAAVVVNDLGGSTNGVGGANAAADKVVEEIKAAGGKAVANYDSVEDGDKVVETALKAFGRIDIVVNNAGILRDKTFGRMSEGDWDLVHRVHLRGSYKVSHAAWPHMLKQKYGRIINTSSAVGLYGNFGQANYSAAKAALVAFSNTLALEGKKSNIIVNTIAPNAGTRMTATVMPPEMVEALKPEYIAPLVAFLAHESNSETGSIFEVGSGWVAKVRWQRTGGVGFPVNRQLLPEHIHSRWNEITNFDDGRATYPSTTQESFSAVQSNFENKSPENAVTTAGKASGSGGVDVEGAKAAVFKSASFEYTERDVIVYALGVGAKRTDLGLVYEASDKFTAIPTFGVIPAFDYQIRHVSFGDYLPNFNPMMLLHGEQYLEIKKPVPVAGKLTSSGKIIDILDKGKGAAVVLGVTTKDASGDVVTENQFTFFIRGSGGFGGKKDSDRGSATASNDPPKRAPDHIVREKTFDDQAALYRLSGDYNPLHIDPGMSSMGGFETPILHGLATFGISGKHIFSTYANNDATKFKSIKARFAKHVFPGETLETHMWKEGNKIIFITKVVERNEIAISNAAVEINDGDVKGAPASSTAAPVEGVVVAGFAASKVFEQLEAGMNATSAPARAALVKKINAVFGFDVTNNGKTQSWFVDLKNAPGKVGTGKPAGKVDMTVVVGDKDFLSVAAGTLNPQKAFMSGKIKIKGNMGLATKLDVVLKLGEAAKAKL